MKARIVGIAAVLLTIIMIGCSWESLVTRGYVTKTNNEAIINVGSANKVQTGDTLQVVHQLNEKRTIISGKVKVVKVLDANSSIVEPLWGKVVQGDRVEEWSR